MAEDPRSSFATRWVFMLLDIGANDGFYTIAALLAGAYEVTAINTANEPTYPENLRFAGKQWNVAPEVVVDDFQT